MIEAGDGRWSTGRRILNRTATFDLLHDRNVLPGGSIMALVPLAFGPMARAGLSQVLFHAWQTVKPEVARVIADPTGAVVRVGEALVWSGPSGQKVLGGLEMLADSEARIETAVNGIETAQLAMQGTLGVVQALSIATLGVTALSGAFMAYRLQALNKRIEALGKDVEGKIDAEHKAHLKSSLQFLRGHDDSPGDKGNLDEALKEARRAANIYGELAADEANGPGRLPVLNCRSRLYVVSLLTELRCLMSADNSKQAIERIDEETPYLKKVAQACFDKTLRSDPERYLRASFQQHDVNLNLLSHVYQQAAQLGIIDQPAVDDANGMFEYVRARLQKGEGYWGWLRRRGVGEELQKLRYLLACLEESSRVAGLKLLIGEIHQRKGSLSELVAKLKEWKQNQEAQERAGEAPPAYAYAL